MSGIFDGYKNKNSTSPSVPSYLFGTLKGDRVEYVSSVKMVRLPDRGSGEEVVSRGSVSVPTRRRLKDSSYPGSSGSY